MNISSLTLPTEQFHARGTIPRNTLVAVEEPDFLLNEMVVRLSRQMAYIPGEDALTLPDGWWQGFKAAHFDVLLKWFPVRYRTFEARGYLPDLTLPRNSGPVVARWLTND